LRHQKATSKLLNDTFYDTFCKTTEWIFWKIGSAARSKFDQQFAQLAIDFRVRDHARLGAQQASYRVERQKWLVRRPLTGAPPHGNITETISDFFRSHSHGVVLPSFRNSRNMEKCRWSVHSRPASAATLTKPDSAAMTLRTSPGV